MLLSHPILFTSHHILSSQLLLLQMQMQQYIKYKINRFTALVSFVLETESNLTIVVEEKCSAI